MEILQSPFGDAQLIRWPIRKQDTLRAWDAADEYLLQHLSEKPALFEGKSPRILLVNDAFGALSVSLRDYQPVNWSDSHLSHLAAEENLRQNQAGQPITLLRSTEAPEGRFDIVLIKIPKTTALLDDQLARLRAHITVDTVIVGAGMVKHLQRSAFHSFEKFIGPLTTSLAQKKARLIFCQLDPALKAAKSPYPSTYTDPDIAMPLINHANVFSREHLDLGARFFLSQLSALPAAQQVIDLACGNGVLGIKLQQQQPDAQLRFLDESYMAIASAQANYLSAFPDNVNHASFEVADGLTTTPEKSADLVVCNPPFHQQHVIGDQIALEMFQGSRHCLVKGGQLWIVANRHLDYIDKLKRIFGNCRTVTSNKKFLILCAVYR
jgi:16S rRNA (guanine1207-N2)-methyltransferase